MPDKLKQYIAAHKEEIEVYGLDVNQEWQTLASQLQVPAKKRNSLLVWRAIAASLLLLLTVAIGVIYHQSNQSHPFPTELVEAQYYYQHQIDQKLELVRMQSDDAALIQDITRLDEAFEELKSDLKEGVQNESVVVAMIDNYRLKLDILEKILAEIEEKNHESYPTL